MNKKKEIKKRKKAHTHTRTHTHTHTHTHTQPTPPKTQISVCTVMTNQHTKFGLNKFNSSQDMGQIVTFKNSSPPTLTLTTATILYEPVTKGRTKKKQETRHSKFQEQIITLKRRRKKEENKKKKKDRQKITDQTCSVNMTFSQLPFRKSVVIKDRL